MVYHRRWFQVLGGFFARKKMPSFFRFVYKRYILPNPLKSWDLVSVQPPAWRIGPHDGRKWLMTMVSKPPRPGVIPLPNGLSMAYKCGWSIHHLRPSWDDPQSGIWDPLNQSQTTSCRRHLLTVIFLVPPSFSFEARNNQKRKVTNRIMTSLCIFPPFFWWPC